MKVPSQLYKYTTGDTARIVLSSGKLRWSSPEIFNDPAEFQRFPHFQPALVQAITEWPGLVVEAAAGKSSIDIDRLGASSKQLFNLAKFAIARGMKPQDLLANLGDETRPLDEMYHERLREFFGPNFTKQARVLCLTANPLNPAMWANYASAHTGCLLGFRHVPEFSTPLQKAQEVSYHHEPPCIGSGLDFLLYGASKEMRGQTIDNICFAKRIEWQYEQEWRVITWRSNEGDALYGDYAFVPQELESITFGLRAPEELVASLVALATESYPTCSLYRMRSLHGELQRIGV